MWTTGGKKIDGWLPSVLTVGAPGSAKSYGAAQDLVAFPGGWFVGDPHKKSLGHLALTHATGNVLYDRLSDLKYPLRFRLLRPSADPDPDVRRAANDRQAMRFADLLLRRRGSDSMASAPLMEEWTLAALNLFLFSGSPKPVSILPYAFMPGTPEFDALLRDCTLPEVRYKFEQLRTLSPRALRAEVGSAARLFNAVFRSPAFLARCDGDFDHAAFFAARGRLIVERGDEIDDDAMRVLIGAWVMLVDDYCRGRMVPRPDFRIYLDECNNARTAGRGEMRGAAETRKNGLTWNFITQLLNFPAGADGIPDLCVRKEVYRSDHDLARKMAAMIVPGLPPTGESRTERVARVADEIVTFRAGHRYVTDAAGSRREYVPMLEEPWPDWGSLRADKLADKLASIHARPEFGSRSMPWSSTSSGSSASPPPTSPPSSAAKRWKFGKGRPPGSA